MQRAFRWIRGAHAARVHCSAARRTASQDGQNVPVGITTTLNSHTPSEFSASGRKRHASDVRSPDSYQASFFRKRRAHRLKSRFDITISTKRFGQYSKKFAPRRMIARISAMKYVVGNSAPSA